MEEAEEALKDVRLKVPDEVTEEKCDLCGRNLVVKSGRFGKFLACPGYPECKFTKPIVERMPGRCPRCGSDVTESKKGFFCERSDCKFGLWRDNKFLTAKRITLDKQMVAALLERGRVRVDDIYSEKTGKRFSTDLLLEDDGVRSSYRFDFGKEGTK